MSKTYLIADSGGTQTDWCFVNENNERSYFTTASFHPNHWNEEFINEHSIFWNSNEVYKSADLHFYGAGCLNPKNNKRINEIFQDWGFNNINIKSDVEAACHAALLKNEGVVAIMGTGSVVCEYNGDSISNLRGGFGYLIGDEGSGYYFGKLLLNKLLNCELSSPLDGLIHEMLGDKNTILGEVYSKEGKKFIGSIALKVSELYQNVEIQRIHEENIELFFSKYVSQSNFKNKTLSIIGRYGNTQAENIKKISGKYGWNIDQFIDAPIFLLTDYILNDTL